MAGLSAYLGQTQAVAAQMPTMQAARMPDASGAEATARLGGALYGVADQIATYEHNKQVQWAGKTYADAASQWYTRLEQLKQSAGDGAPNFVENLQGEFQKFRAETLASTNNHVAKQFLDEKFTGLNADLSRQALHFQAHAQVQQSENNIEQTVNTLGTSAMPYESKVDALNSVVDTSTLQAGYKTAYKMKARIALAKTQGMQEIERDPQAMYDMLKGRIIGELGEPSLDPTNVQRPSWVDDLPMQERLSLESHALSRSHQRTGQLRAGVENKANDHEARFLQGLPVAEPMTKVDFHAAYRPEEVEPKWAQYVTRQQLGADIQSMGAMSAGDIAGVLQKTRTEMEAATEGQSVAFVDRYNRTLEAAKRIQQAREKDPMASALQGQLFGVESLDYSDPVKFKDQMAARQAAAIRIGAEWGVDSGPLSKDEASKASAFLASAGVADQMQYLHRIKGALTDPKVYGAAVKQIAEGNPVVAAAGHILGQDRAATVAPAGWLSSSQQIAPQIVASRMLSGLATMRESQGVFSPVADRVFQGQFWAEVGDALPSNPVAAQAMYKSAKAYVVGKLSEEGNLNNLSEGYIGKAGNPGSGLASEAVRAVTGGVASINGHKVIPPYGADPLQFEPLVRAETKRILTDAGVPPKSRLLPFEQYRVIPGGGQNRYMLSAGGQTLINPKTQQPVILDFNNPKAWVLPKPAEWPRDQLNTIGY